MCRWIAYIGDEIYLENIIIKPSSSLVEQSLHAKLSYSHDGKILSTNGDGFGIGWYYHKNQPGLFKSSEPAWANENISEICSQTKAHIFMSHIRAASTGSVQRNNSHPFKYNNILFQHNGYIKDFALIRKDMLYILDNKLFNEIKGTTDTEAFFMIAIYFGLEKSPKIAIEKTIKFILDLHQKHNIAPKIQLSCAISDGNSIFTIRYSTLKKQNTQFYSTDVNCLTDIDNKFNKMPDNSFVIVSEPINNSFQNWNEVPPSSFVTFSNAKTKIEPLNI